MLIITGQDKTRPRARKGVRTRTCTTRQDRLDSEKLGRASLHLLGYLATLAPPYNRYYTCCCTRVILSPDPLPPFSGSQLAVSLPGPSPHNSLLGSISVRVLAT